MKKRAISLLLALLMVISLAPSALAAEEDPPYALRYLEGIEGSEYVRYQERDDYVSSTGEDVTQATAEMYDVLDLWIDADWEGAVAPFRQRFRDAGFTEEVKSDENGDNEYWYTDGSGHLFRIMGEKASQAVINESGLVYVLHDFSAKFMDAQTAPQTPVGTLDNFKRSRTYTPGQFADIPASAWYAPAVQTAYELGMVNGSGAGYAPADPITVAETLVLACRIRDIYYGGTGEFTQGSPWYQVYVDYAVENEIITGGFQDYAAAANRETFASIMAKALPGTALAPVNDIEAGAIADSASISAAALPAVLRLYNAGILTGSDDQGTFHPNSSIQRSEVAAIAARMAIPGERKRFTLSVPEVPAEPGSVLYAGEDVPDFGAFAGIEEKDWSSGDFGTYHYYDLGKVQQDSTLVDRYYDLLTEKGFQYRRMERINSASMAVYGKDSVEVAIGQQEHGGGKDFCVLIGWGNSFPNAGTSSGESAPSSSGSSTGSGGNVTNMDYAYRALDYFYKHMKFPSTMEVQMVRCGEYDRVSFYDGAPDMLKANGKILSLSDDYYVVVSTIKGANSLGVMVTKTYVSLFDVTTGDVYYDLVDRAESAADSAWGEKKLGWMELQSEGLLLSATIKFPELTREQIAQLMADIKK